MSIDNAVLGPVPKRLLFTMVKNTDFLCSVHTNPYNSWHYNFSNFTLFLNRKQFPNVGLSLGMDHEKTSVIWYRTLFEGSCIHISNCFFQNTHDMYIAGFFMLLFDLTQDLGASDHASRQDNGNIRIYLKFSKLLSDTITFYYTWNMTILSV